MLQCTITVVKLDRKKYQNRHDFIETAFVRTAEPLPPDHSLNMELDLQSFIWAPCAQQYSLAETPQLPPHLGSDKRALLVSQDRRHLFVSPLLPPPSPLFICLIKIWMQPQIPNI